jgi:hypothetical protein
MILLAGATALDRASADAALLGQVTQHWFRHLFATRMLRLDPRAAMEQAGWADIRSLMGYAQDVPGFGRGRRDGGTPHNGHRWLWSRSPHLPATTPAVDLGGTQESPVDSWATVRTNLPSKCAPRTTGLPGEPW